MKESVNSLVPRDNAELALLFELFMCGGEGDTGYIVERAIDLQSYISHLLFIIYH